MHYTATKVLSPTLITGERQISSGSLFDQLELTTPLENYPAGIVWLHALVQYPHTKMDKKPAIYILLLISLCLGESLYTNA